jgi:hypothetical protein
MLKLFNRADKPSAHIKKRYGDMGSPWRRPRDGVKLGRSSPFTFTEKLAEVTHFIIKWTIPGEKPNLSMIASRKGHSTRS